MYNCRPLPLTSDTADHVNKTTFKNVENMFKDDGKCGESRGMSDLTKLVDCKDGVTSHLSTYHVSQMRLLEHYELILVGIGLFDWKYKICDKTELLVLHANIALSHH